MIEVERYELRESPAYQFAAGRRDFLKFLGFGLTMLIVSDADAQESGRRRTQHPVPAEINAWIHVGDDNRVTVFTGKVEVGQNIRTSLTQAVVEELKVAPEAVLVQTADTDLTPYDMGTFGSRTTPTMAPQIRKAAAAAREELLDLAAKQWSVDRASLVAADGRVKNANRSIAFGELMKGQQLVRTIDASSTPAQPLGTSLGKVNAAQMVTGSHRYTSDLKRPGMLYGRVLRAPTYGAKLVNAKSTGKIIRDGDFVGVVAADEHAAAKALQSIDAEWKTEPHPSSKDLFAYLKANAETPAKTITIPQDAAHKLETTHNIAYIAHCPLEPRAALAEWTGDKLTVWTGTQVPFGVKGELAEAFGIPEAQVRVIVPDTGSGYGGKHTGECAIEAARLAKAAGKPVKLIWTREEEFMWAYFRPAGLIEVRSAVDKNGLLTAWEFHNYNSGGSAIETPYDVANKSVQFIGTKSPLRQGSYRGLAATANHFARETHIDELAHTAGIEPLEFRYRNLSNPRMKAVLAAAAERFGWGKKGSTGISCGFEKGSYVACCVEVSIPAPNQVKVERVVISFECGAIVNPRHLENQVEGSVVMALGGALFEHVEFENGKLLNGRFSKYRVPRFSDLPKIETVLLDRKDLPSAGAGETPIVGLAPAVANAVFQATGTRHRSLPMFA